MAWRCGSLSRKRVLRDYLLATSAVPSIAGALVPDRRMGGKGAGKGQGAADKAVLERVEPRDIHLVGAGATVSQASNDPRCPIASGTGAPECEAVSRVTLRAADNLRRSVDRLAETGHRCKSRDSGDRSQYLLSAAPGLCTGNAVRPDSSSTPSVIKGVQEWQPHASIRPMRLGS